MLTRSDNPLLKKTRTRTMPIRTRSNMTGRYTKKLMMSVFGIKQIKGNLGNHSKTNVYNSCK